MNTIKSFGKKYAIIPAFLGLIFLCVFISRTYTVRADSPYYESTKPEIPQITVELIESKNGLKISMPHTYSSDRQDIYDLFFYAKKKGEKKYKLISVQTDNADQFRDGLFYIYDMDPGTYYIKAKVRRSFREWTGSGPDDWRWDYENAVYSKCCKAKKITIPQREECPEEFRYLYEQGIIDYYVEPISEKEQAQQYILMGEWDYDDDGEKEPLEWQILDYSDDGTKALVLCNRSIATIRYGDPAYGYDVFWQHSLVRNWLLDEFLLNAFDQSERQSINRTSRWDYYPNQEYYTYENLDNGESLVLGYSEAQQYAADGKWDDFAFILTGEEFIKYTDIIDNCRCKECYCWLMPYVAKGYYCHVFSDDSYVVSYEDELYSGYGHYAVDEYGVRPAMWVDITPDTPIYSKYDLPSFRKYRNVTIYFGSRVPAWNTPMARGLLPDNYYGTPERFEWKILEISEDGKKALLILDSFSIYPGAYDSKESTTWAKSDFRKWYNNDFLYGEYYVDIEQTTFLPYFTDAQRNIILPTKAPKSVNPETGVSSGKATTDYFFLLSVEEMNKYLYDPLVLDTTLRTPGSSRSSHIEYRGYEDYGYYVMYEEANRYYSEGHVAMWIDLQPGD